MRADLLSSRQNYKIYPIFQNNKKRIIEEPIPELKQIQKDIVSKYSKTIKFHKSVYGIGANSIFDNASIHFNATNLLKVDIKEFYRYVRIHHVLNANYDYGFNISDDDIALSFIWNDRLNVEMVPTGAPTSPIMANVALTPLDYQISHLLKGTEYRYTRYMDDLHISTMSEKRDWSLLYTVYDLITALGFKPNKKKSKWISPTKDSSIVTGVNIGVGSKVPRSFHRMLRAKINNHAKVSNELSAEIAGCLAYVKSLDIDKYNDYIKYFQERVSRCKANP